MLKLPKLYQLIILYYKVICFNLRLEYQDLEFEPQVKGYLYTSILKHIIYTCHFISSFKLTSLKNK